MASPFPSTSRRSGIDLSADVWKEMRPPLQSKACLACGTGTGAQAQMDFSKCGRVELYFWAETDCRNHMITFRGAELVTLRLDWSMINAEDGFKSWLKEQVEGPNHTKSSIQLPLLHLGTVLAPMAVTVVCLTVKIAFYDMKRLITSSNDGIYPLRVRATRAKHIKSPANLRS